MSDPDSQDTPDAAPASRATQDTASEAAFEATLITRIAQGDLAALGLLYDRHIQGLHRFIRGAAPGDDAQDVAQTVFLRVSRIAGGFNGDGRFVRPWIFGIAARVIRERRRALVRFVRVLKSVVSPPPAASVRAGEGVDLERGLRRLSASKRTVLLLAELEGFSGPEIARMLDVPVGTVWTRLHHARAEMRAFLQGKP